MTFKRERNSQISTTAKKEDNAKRDRNECNKTKKEKKK
jgi:hypothetical protein